MRWPKFWHRRNQRSRDAILTALAACEPPREVVVIEEPTPTVAGDALHAILRPIQPLREQLTAITGLGLGGVGDLSENGIRRASVEVPEMALSLSYLSAGDPAGQRVLFIHGSPGAAEEWANFLVAVPAGQHRIAVDRPGFGLTRPEEPILSLAGQAGSLRPLIGGDGSRSTILVGYSYGGPVALKAAIDMPEAVSGVLLVSSAADPGQEEVHPLQALVSFETFTQMLPTQLVNANAELIALKHELEALADELGRLDVPVTIVHGVLDNLVPPANVLYLSRQLPSSSTVRIVLVEDGDHFLPWTYPGKLNSALALLADKVRGRKR